MNGPALEDNLFKGCTILGAILGIIVGFSVGVVGGAIL